MKAIPLKESPKSRSRCKTSTANTLARPISNTALSVAVGFPRGLGLWISADVAVACALSGLSAARGRTIVFANPLRDSLLTSGQYQCYTNSPMWHLARALLLHDRLGLIIPGAVVSVSAFGVFVEIGLDNSFRENTSNPHSHAHTDPRLLA
jgi:hypothetical protein